jgi:hydrogenase maturation protease
MTVIGVQPVELNDFGGSLREPVRARIPEAVELAAQELAAWGNAGRLRAPDEKFVPLSVAALGMAAYEQGVAPADDLGRYGDPRLLALRLAGRAG